MKNYAFLTASPPFNGMTPEELSPLLTCLNAREKHYPKGSYILHAQEYTQCFGIVISGEALVIYVDIFGNRNLLDHLKKGDLFAEVFAYSGAQLPFGVTAATDCSVLFIEADKLSNPCGQRCGFHSRIIANMLGVIASQNIRLMSKLEVVSRRTTREKLLCYLSMQAVAQGSDNITIPFDRQGLADYLNVDRSAMSSELGKLRDEGILIFRKNKFKLLIRSDP